MQRPGLSWCVPAHKKQVPQEVNSSIIKHGDVKRARDPSELCTYSFLFIFFISVVMVCVTIFMFPWMVADKWNFFFFFLHFQDEPFLSEQQFYESHLALQRGGRVNR